MTLRVLFWPRLVLALVLMFAGFVLMIPATGTVASPLGRAAEIAFGLVYIWCGYRISRVSTRLETDRIVLRGFGPVRRHARSDVIGMTTDRWNASTLVTLHMRDGSQDDLNALDAWESNTMQPVIDRLQRWIDGS